MKFIRIDEQKLQAPFEYYHCYIEDIPPFDILVRAATESAAKPDGGTYSSSFVLKGVHLAESGGTLSVHDIYTEIMYQYVAEFIIPFHSNMTIKELKTALTASSSNQPRKLTNEYEGQRKSLQEDCVPLGYT